MPTSGVSADTGLRARGDVGAVLHAGKRDPADAFVGGRPRGREIVADSGDFSSLRKYQPRDATTNPSLLLKAAEMPEYSDLFARVLAERLDAMHRPLDLGVAVAALDAEAQRAGKQQVVPRNAEQLVHHPLLHQLRPLAPRPPLCRWAVKLQM